MYEMYEEGMDRVSHIRSGWYFLFYYLADQPRYARFAHDYFLDLTLHSYVCPYTLLR